MTGGHKSQNQTPALVVKLPGIRLVGRAAVIALLALVALVVALIIYSKPTLSRALIPGLL